MSGGFLARIAEGAVFGAMMLLLSLSPSLIGQ